MNTLSAALPRVRRPTLPSAHLIERNKVIRIALLESLHRWRLELQALEYELRCAVEDGHDGDLIERLTAQVIEKRHDFQMLAEESNAMGELS